MSERRENITECIDISRIIKYWQTDGIHEGYATRAHIRLKPEKTGIY